jgi:hypothetical protein
MIRWWCSYGFEDQNKAGTIEYRQDAWVELDIRARTTG